MVKKIFLNRKLFAIHSWLGLFLGFFYLLISISGALSVFRFELNSLIYGHKTNIVNEPSKKRLSYDSIFSIARKEVPGMPYYVCGFEESYENAPAFYSAVTHVRPRLFESSMQYKVNYLNPYTGELKLPTNSQGKNNVIDWIMGFHYSFAFGEGGELFVVLLDIALLISIITGFIFYRKYVLKALTFRVKIKFTNWRVASSGLHRVIGTWALLFNLFIFLSGLYIQRKFFTEKWWDKYTHTENGEHHHTDKISYPSSLVSLDSLKTIAMAKAPNMHFLSFSIDCGHGGGISALGIKQESIFQAYDNIALVNFDSAGNYVNTYYRPWKEYSAADKFNDINFSFFHTGWAFGTPGKILWCIMGFSPAFLSITGFLLWWRKKKWKAHSGNKAISSQVIKTNINGLKVFL
ncbi:MAG TPA: PepSY-associated TM helix domain-containing protein [Puia sp.]|nr:PepSY-associated TM helix domain-containing protein [Puia sp.]